MAKKPGTSLPRDPSRTICVIGAGLAGLALAIRLQAAGLQTTLIEARGCVGGLLRRIEHPDFAFEEGPALIADPEPLRELFCLSGDDDDAALNLVPIDPVCRFLWSDGTSFDAAGDPAELVRQVARLAPADVGAVDEWRLWSATARSEAWPQLAQGLPQGISAWGQALSLFRRSRAWQSPSGLAAHFFQEPHLRQALAHGALFAGANPGAASSLVLAGQPLAGSGAGFWPIGGMARLAETLAARFTALGGTVRLHDPVARIETLGSRVSEVETLSGWRSHFAAVASTADAVHTYRTLIKDSPRASEIGKRLAARRFAPSALTVHFALAGTWPGIAHQTVLVGPRFDALLADIFEAGVLPRDMLIWLHHPTVTDPALAPPGHSLMRATIPVAHLGKLPIDWDTVGPMVAERVVAEVGRRLIPDIEDRILARHLTTPRDLALELGLHLGSGWSLETLALHVWPPRLGHRDTRISNLYFAGAATHPGAGVAGVLAGAKACARHITGDIT